MVQTVAMRTRFGIVLGLALLFACNKHDVPLGGACKRGEDCDKSGLACLRGGGADTGYCSKPCSIAPPGTSITSGGQTCEQAGMVCEKATVPHPLLGPAYCVKK